MRGSLSKGEETRRAVVQEAMRFASTFGLEGLSIGTLADKVGLSKSGLFAHFRSKERLQIEVLDAAAELFVARVVRPAMRAPRGEPRARALLERWLEWAFGDVLPGGCLFITAAVELDDREGPVRDAVVKHQQAWLDVLVRAFDVAQKAGHHQARLDPSQLAFEAYGIMLATHHARRLLNDRDAATRAQTAFESLLTRARG